MRVYLLFGGCPLRKCTECHMPASHVIVTCDSCMCRVPYLFLSSRQLCGFPRFGSCAFQHACMHARCTNGSCIAWSVDMHVLALPALCCNSAADRDTPCCSVSRDASAQHCCLAALGHQECHLWLAFQAPRQRQKQRVGVWVLSQGAAATGELGFGGLAPCLASWAVSALLQRLVSGGKHIIFAVHCRPPASYSLSVLVVG
jgi:hypothetical protein